LTILVVVPRVPLSSPPVASRKQTSTFSCPSLDSLPLVPCHHPGSRTTAPAPAPPLPPLPPPPPPEVMDHCLWPSPRCRHPPSTSPSSRPRRQTRRLGLLPPWVNMFGTDIFQFSAGDGLRVVWLWGCLAMPPNSPENASYICYGLFPARSMLWLEGWSARRTNGSLAAKSWEGQAEGSQLSRTAGERTFAHHQTGILG